jgi:hypothetical protein
LLLFRPGLLFPSISILFFVFVFFFCSLFAFTYSLVVVYFAWEWLCIIWLTVEWMTRGIISWLPEVLISWFTMYCVSIQLSKHKWMVSYWLMYSADGMNDDQGDTIGKFIQNLARLPWQRIRSATHAQKSLNGRFYSSKQTFLQYWNFVGRYPTGNKADGLLKLCHVM